MNISDTNFSLSHWVVEAGLTGCTPPSAPSGTLSRKGAPAFILHSKNSSNAMAEPFETFAGALGVAGLFNNRVDCFEYIQLGHHVGRDYERCQLRLDIAKVRLGRWGEAVKIKDDPRFHSNVPVDKSVQLAQSIIEEIMLLFESAQKRSKQYELVADQQDLVIASFIDKLKKAFPVEAVCYNLAEVEIEEIEDDGGLIMLKDAARGIDAAFSDTAVQKIAKAGRNSAKGISMEDRARVHLGNPPAQGEKATKREELRRNKDAMLDCPEELMFTSLPEV
ncbi:hypothetical protein DL767_000361 [Monosporascus sp. MG133]|nr:hypothetical protein DL767_000361 [Monosporascus sp. MG133]